MDEGAAIPSLHAMIGGGNPRSCGQRRGSKDCVHSCYISASGSRVSLPLPLPGHLRTQRNHIAILVDTSDRRTCPHEWWASASHDLK
jgi:hypothetical protein